MFDVGAVRHLFQWGDENFSKIQNCFSNFLALFYSELVCLTSNINVVCQEELFEGSNIKIQTQIKILEQNCNFVHVAPEHTLLRVVTAILSQMTIFLTWTQ